MRALEIMELLKGDQKLEFIPTGFPKLDSFLDGGFLRKEMIILGGPSGSGKSYLAGQIFYNVAQEGYKGLYISLEISNKMIVSRLIGALSNLKPTRIMAGLLDAEERELTLKARAKISNYQNLMDFEDDLYLLPQIKTKIKTSNPDFVVIDFLQNVMLPGKGEYDRLSEVSLELQKLAKEQNCAILCLSQLSNQMVREGANSQVIEYKGSGSITQISDLGFQIQKEANGLQLNLRKNRRGISNVKFSLSSTYPGGWFTEL